MLVGLERMIMGNGKKKFFTYNLLPITYNPQKWLMNQPFLYSYNPWVKA